METQTIDGREWVDFDHYPFVYPENWKVNTTAKGRWDAAVYPHHSGQKPVDGEVFDRFVAQFADYQLDPSEGRLTVHVKVDHE